MAAQGGAVGTVADAAFIAPGERVVTKAEERRVIIASSVGTVFEWYEGVPCDVVHVVAEHAYQAIIDAARSRGCDLIVMASHGRKGISGLVLGSETIKVLTHSKIPVLVCR